MKTSFSFVFALLFAVTLSVHADPKAPAALPPDPVLGQWIWHGGYPVTVNPDGTTAPKTGAPGTWKFLQNKEIERKYQFIWGGGVFIDTMKLVHENKRLEGKNQKGEKVWADRAPVP